MVEGGAYRIYIILYQLLREGPTNIVYNMDVMDITSHSPGFSDKAQ